MCVTTFETQSTLVSPGGRGGGKGGRADINATFISDYLEILGASTVRRPKALSRQVTVSFTFDVLITIYQTGIWGSLQGPVLSNLKRIVSKFSFVLTGRLRTERKTMKRINLKFIKHSELSMHLIFTAVCGSVSFLYYMRLIRVAAGKVCDNIRSCIVTE